MGCLLEFILETVFELIYICYIELMSLIVPKHVSTEETRNRIKRGVKVYASVLLIVLVLGVILYIQADPVIHLVGQYLTLISLSIMGLQILLGVIVRIFIRK